MFDKKIPDTLEEIQKPRNWFFTSKFSIMVELFTVNAVPAAEVIIGVPLYPIRIVSLLIVNCPVYAVDDEPFTNIGSPDGSVWFNESERLQGFSKLPSPSPETASTETYLSAVTGLTIKRKDTNNINRIYRE
ncbi:hypothetical protein [uncultured Methanospirillum sp.]|uniref:hypothetical protein n=1 Tax=uncultured Methanospirillum sp. TaxID=262503 RepID=UPI0029C94F46|nr:hypothetical protein [uncultured Methanospirillum sp.]